MIRRIGLAARAVGSVVALTGALSLSPAVARAEHAMGMSHAHQDEPEVSLGLAVLAAEFDNAVYVGDYQAITPSLSWARGWFGASAAIGLYHLTENGLSRYGAGDIMLASHAMLFATDAVHGGVALHVMLPTGDEVAGFGMGHAMATPSAWASWRAAPFTVTASGGYARALTSLGGSGHDHGPMPVVDPMNMQELTWSASADVDLGQRVQLGGRTLGGIPIGTGRTRVIGGGRIAWGTPRISTALEAQLGIAGDPFIIRGVLETTLRF